MRVPTGNSSGAACTLAGDRAGVFSAEYPGEMNSDDACPETFPDAHIGTDASGVRIWVEEMAAGLGYDRVVWEPAEERR
jgi:hypothetical protein